MHYVEPQKPLQPFEVEQTGAEHQRDFAVYFPVRVICRPDGHLDFSTFILLLMMGFFA
jgi:hypothetical protein